MQIRINQSLGLEFTNRAAVVEASADVGNEAEDVVQFGLDMITTALLIIHATAEVGGLEDALDTANKFAKERITAAEAGDKA